MTRKERFFKAAAPVEGEGGHTVALDGKPVRTPKGRMLTVPGYNLADALAGEWNAQGAEIKPNEMPLTKAVNAALDHVEAQFEAVAESIAGYGRTDLLCYRAEAEADLAARQAEAWDPWIDWAGERLGARLQITAGVMAVSQHPDALEALRRAVRDCDAIGLTGLHMLTSLTGSVVLGLAVARGELDADRAWALSRVDETWQEERWGADKEAAALAEAKRTELLAAERLIRLLEA